MFSSQRTALFTQDMVQAPLSRGHSYRSLILQARERHINLGLWLSPCQKEPWITLTHTWPSQGVNSSRSSYGTTGSLYFQFLQVSIKSKSLHLTLVSFITAFKQCPVQNSLICTCCIKPCIYLHVTMLWCRYSRTQGTSRNLSFCPAHRCWRLSRHYRCKNTLDRLTKEWLKSLKDQGGEWQSF